MSYSGIIKQYTRSREIGTGQTRISHPERIPSAHHCPLKSRAGFNTGAIGPMHRGPLQQRASMKAAEIFLGGLQLRNRTMISRATVHDKFFHRVCGTLKAALLVSTVLYDDHIEDMMIDKFHKTETVS
jgi:hypothetical protein